MRKNGLILLSVCLLLSMMACSRVSQPPVQAANNAGALPAAATAAPTPSANSDVTPAPATPSEPQAVNISDAQALTIPAGTSFRVRLLETIDTRHNRAGDTFTASLDEPLVDGDRVVVPKNTRFTGHIVEAKASGRFKGRALLALRLDTFTMNNRNYEIRSTSTSRVSAGHKKHDFLWIGGGSGGGAMIGAAAGGGAGALIGAGVGAASGTVGSVITGKRQVRLPVETALRFTLKSAVNVGG